MDTDPRVREAIKNALGEHLRKERPLLANELAKALAPLVVWRAAADAVDDGWESYGWVADCGETIVPKRDDVHCIEVFVRRSVTPPALEPHEYWPDFQAQGDCTVCGHVESASLHVRSVTPSETRSGEHADWCTAYEWGPCHYTTDDPRERLWAVRRD